MNRRKQKKIDLRKRKDKLRRKTCLVKKHQDRLDMLKKQQLEEQKLEDTKVNNKKPTVRIRKKLKRLKLWIIDNTYIRLLNYFRNLFKSNA